MTRDGSYSKPDDTTGYCRCQCPQWYPYLCQSRRQRVLAQRSLVLYSLQLIMPSYRSRSPSERRRSESPPRRRERSRDNDRDVKSKKRRHQDYDRERDHPSDASDEVLDLPEGAKSITQDDYFLRNAEFRKWLKDEKDRVRFTIGLFQWVLLIRSYSISMN